MKALNNKKVLLTGALVFDTIFDLANPIRDQIIIKDGKPGKQNLMFNAHEKRIYFGGMVGNIAYGLSLLNCKALLVSALGQDCADYLKHLRRKGLEHKFIIDRDSFNATFYGLSDPNREQIGIFQGNAYYKNLDRLSLSKMLKKSDWKDIGIAIFSPGTAQSITRDITEFRKHSDTNAITIFDPGQMLMVDFTKELLKGALSHSNILILNDIELSHIKNHFGFSLEKIFLHGVKYVIETRGEDGSTLHEVNKRTDVKALKIKKVVDPTGAGDAYRAGLISGLLSAKTLVESMQIGARLGALCVQHSGAQTYKL